MTSLLGLDKVETNGVPGHIDDAVTVRGERLTIETIARVVSGTRVRLSYDDAIRGRIQASCDFIRQAVEDSTAIYGVTTCFGGMADQVIPKETAAELQSNLIWSHKAGTGARLPEADVRAGMLLRANSLTQGISALRPEILRRLVGFFYSRGTAPRVRGCSSVATVGHSLLAVEAAEV